MPDIRPLTGEPLPLDLANTVWNVRGERQDLFDDLDAMKDWLNGHDLPAAATPRQLHQALTSARHAIRAVLEGTETADDRLDEVLRHGSRRPTLASGQPAEVELIDRPAWHAAWRCAAAFVDLLRDKRSRIRKCANPLCILWYVDTTRNAGRRWCSMETCGNRAKASRFHERGRASASPASAPHQPGIT